MVINLHHDILALCTFQYTLELATTLKGAAQAQFNVLSNVVRVLFELEQQSVHTR